MKPERWRQVEKLYQAALTKHPDNRGAFVAEASVSEEVRREVVSLLSQSASGHGPLDRPAWEGGGGIDHVTDTLKVQVAPGTLLGPYRIEDQLGEGGMGVVYRARDTRLNRPVAIKFLSDDLLSVAARRRFQREAQMASALNHPHILTVYDAGESEGRLYLVTELVDGGTLREWSGGSRSWDEILDLLVGVADGLAVAHQAGILHRDIKPANILISKSGYAKLADFGLAKLIQNAGEWGASSLDEGRTVPGAIIGTIAYMSPEQASGGSVDVRSDIFSFGLVLYETLVGRRAFVGNNEVEVLQKIRSEKPDALPPHIPAGLRAVVEKALEKNSQDRYQSMRELVADLKRLQRLTSDEIPQRHVPQSAASLRRWRFIGVICAAVLVVALGAVFWALRQRDYFWQNPLDGARIERLTDFETDEVDAAISRDGKLVSFVSDRDGRYDAWISQIGSGEFVNITKGHFPNLDPGPIRKVGFSGDGARIWFQTYKGPTQPYRGWLASVVGGTPQSFLTRGMEVSWSPDGTQIVYHTDDPGDPLFISEPNGSNARRIYAEKPEGHCHHPTWSSDGRFIYFVKGIPTTDEMDIWRVPSSSPSAGAERITYHNARVGFPAWLDARTLIYSATAEDGSGQWLYALDVERRIPHRVSSGLREQYLSVAVSEGFPRRIVCTVAIPSASLWTVPVSDRIEPETSASRLAISNSRALGPRFAQDDLLFLSSRGGVDGIWRREGSDTKELWKGSVGGVVAPPSASPDGTRICFSYRTQGRVRLYVIDANGTNLRTLAESLEVRSSPSWSPDSKWVTVAGTDKEGTRVFIVPVDGGSPVRLVDTASYNPLWSPNGRYVVYSEPIRGAQLAVKGITMEKTPVPLPAIVVTYTTATPYRFASDGKALILIKEADDSYRARNFYWMNLETGRERQLTQLKSGYLINSFDVSPDGKQIVFDRLRDNADIVLMELRR